MNLKLLLDYGLVYGFGIAVFVVIWAGVCWPRSPKTKIWK